MIYVKNMKHNFIKIVVSSPGLLVKKTPHFVTFLHEYYPGEYLASSKDDQEPPSTIRDLR